MSYLAIPEEIEIFPESVFGIVEETIEAYKPGKVKFLDISWQARFYGDFSETKVVGDGVYAQSREASYAKRLRKEKPSARLGDRAICTQCIGVAIAIVGVVNTTLLVVPIKESENSTKITLY